MQLFVRLAGGVIATAVCVSAAVADCPADIDDSGVVGASDLVQVLVNWGECPRCAADVTGDGVVDVEDLLSVIPQWGPCPFVWPDTCLVDEVMTLEVSSSLGTVTLVYSQAEGVWVNENWYVWCLTQDCASPFPPSTSLDLADPDTGNVIATLQFAKVQVVANHDMSVNVKLVAGAADTTVSLRGPVAGFAAIDGAIAEGRATASVAISDYNCDGWAEIAGDGPPGTGIGRAIYNVVDGSASLFSELIGNAGTNNCWPWFGTGSSADPASGHRPVGETVSDAGVEIVFVLSHGDWANVSASFEVVPDLEGTCVRD